MPDLQYREALREKLLDLSGELKTGRNEFSTGSVMYRSLNNSISAVLKVLEDHEGEDVLDDDARRELEDKIVLMKRQAKGYARHKTEEGGLIVEAGADEADIKKAEINLKRVNAAEDILKISSRIPRNPGEDYGIIAPSRLESGDKRETDWRLRWKQNVRYLGRKQLATYERHRRQYQPSNRLEQEDFNALMDLVGKKHILAYRDDAHLCQKYPKLRMQLEKAIHAAELVKDMSEDELSGYLMNWGVSTVEQSVAAAEKAKKRQGKPFTDAERAKLTKQQEELAQEKIKKFGSPEKLGAAGDFLEQVARFADLKMKVISDKNYVKLPHTNSLGHIFSVEEYESLAKNSKTESEREFNQNLRDIRELEDAGIRHLYPQEGVDKALYRKVHESKHVTFKREMFGYKQGTMGFNGLSVANNLYGATDSSTVTKATMSQNRKVRVGKIGLKLHSEHKHLQVSGSVALGQVKSSKIISASLSSPGVDLMLSHEATLVRARIKAQAKRGLVGASIGANGSFGYANGLVRGGIGNITVKDSEGNEHKTLGLSGKVQGMVGGVKGGAGGTLNLFGLKIGVSFTAYGGAAGVEFGGEATLGGVGFSLGAALGIGAGLAVSVNWSELVHNVKEYWRNSKLGKLINRFKENKRVKKEEEAYEKEHRAKQQKKAFNEMRKNINELGKNEHQMDDGLQIINEPAPERRSQGPAMGMNV